jgi:hypothetical protein
MLFEETVKLPYDDVLLPWAKIHDTDAARIILAVQAKSQGTPQIASQRTGNAPNSSELPVPDEIVPSEPVTILLAPQDGRRLRRKYSNRAEQQKAYRERKAIA